MKTTPLHRYEVRRTGRYRDDKELLDLVDEKGEALITDTSEAFIWWVKWDLEREVA